MALRPSIIPVTAAGIAASLLVWACVEPFAEQRERMVREQIEARGIRNADVLRWGRRFHNRLSSR